MDTRVQGPQAAQEVAAALDTLSAQGPGLGIDVVILTRGGGSVEDLWAFNERIVADAVLRCSLPVVAAIGHETDTTIAELVADLRCSTPTQAAMRVVPDRAALGEQVEHLRERMASTLNRRVQAMRQRVESAASRPCLRWPRRVYEPWRRRLEAALRGLRSLPARAIRSRRERVEALAQRLQAVSPTRVLLRGYTLTLDAEGHALRRADAVRAGDALTTVFADGRVSSVVAGGEGGAASSSQAEPTPPALGPVGGKAGGGAPRSRRGKSKGKGPEGPGLFA